MGRGTCLREFRGQRYCGSCKDGHGQWVALTCSFFGEDFLTTRNKEADGHLIGVGEDCAKGWAYSGNVCERGLAVDGVECVCCIYVENGLHVCYLTWMMQGVLEDVKNAIYLKRA